MSGYKIIMIGYLVIKIGRDSIITRGHNIMSGY